MKSDKLTDAIGMIDEDLIAEADIKMKKGYIQYIKWLIPVAAVLMIMIVSVPFLKQDKPIIKNPLTESTSQLDEQLTDRENTTQEDNSNNLEIPSKNQQEEPSTGTLIPSIGDNIVTPVVKTLNFAKYPQMMQYPSDFNDLNAWYDSKKERKVYYGAGKNLGPFFWKTSGAFLSGAGSENRLYSPLNVYMALAMTAEISDGETRQQILDLIGADSMESLRKQANSVWNANYSNDGAVTSILASSLWLNDNISFNKKIIDTLGTNYYASSYQGTMGSEKMNKELRKWLNSQTGGMLSDEISDIKLDSKTVMALATTIFYQAKWQSDFLESNTVQDVFHSPTGDITCDFMKRTEYDELYFWGKNFSAISKQLANSGKMYFILPDENVSVDDLLSDNELKTFLTNGSSWRNYQKIKINLSVPKFDVSSEQDLKKGLQNLGVTNCFDEAKSDFSSLCPDFKDPIFISKIEHGVRVAIDEEGVTATAYTVEMLAGATRPTEDEIDFVLDRPFIFVITSDDGLPLFIGVVNQP
ncbi:MAG: hypothetical protein IKC45_02450 [Clostridia bacterium]|nr:hypothetical protein [Clostridia bacterium]